MEVESLDHFKSFIAHKFFVVPADGDYLIARWLLLNGFQPELFWHVSQAIEKYLKASMILNGHQVDSRKGNGHDLNSLYHQHIEIMGDLAHTHFRRPDDLNPDLWRDETIVRFIERIALIGSPDSRYGLVSWWRHRDDLFKIDQICWALRRLTIGMDWVIGNDVPSHTSMIIHRGKTYRDALREDSEATPRGVIETGERKLCHVGQDRRDLLHAWNFSFRRCQGDLIKPAPRIAAPTVGPAGNSYLFIFWRLLTRTDEDGRLMALDPHIEPGLRWLIETIRLPKGVKEQIEAQLAIPRPR